MELEVYLAKTMPELNDAQKSRFIRYYELLAEHNGRVNLTAITDPESVCEKHFADSLLASELIPAALTASTSVPARVFQAYRL